ncbi:MAG: hypothetical protein JSS81_05880 [Acidobacteria bacterium]|nr:hypothetical protein [Acidobacteriota bacterium]
MRRDADVALRLSIERLRDFLLGHKDTDFKDGDDFAGKLLEGIESAFADGWQTVRAVQAIRRTTKSIYEFYRLKDVTVFGGQSPVRLKLGGADNKSINFIDGLDHFYFSKFAPNTSQPLRKFFVDRYFKDGAALFGRESTEELADFRAAAGEKLKNFTDRQTKTIVQTSVSRVRNWAHIGSLSQAKIQLARIVATLDSRTTEICRELDGKLLRVGVAQTAIERLNQLEPGDFAAELYESPIGKAISKEPVKTIQSFLEDDGKTISDKLVEMGRGFPPYHPNCRTRMEGIIPGLE